MADRNDGLIDRSSEDKSTNCNTAIIYKKKYVTGNSIQQHNFTPVSEEYEMQVTAGKLLFDPWQQRAARKLTRLQKALKDYDHSKFLEKLERFDQCDSLLDDTNGTVEDKRQMKKDEQNKSSATKALGDTKLSIPIRVPRGFYLHGNVGTGKSLLLNIFFSHAPVRPPNKKRRIHFHSLLQEIHQRIHSLNKQLLQQHGRSFHVNTSKSRNPILRIAQQLSEEVTLLCIDEFQVTDIADAMILSQLFGELWRRGVVVIATSNRPPSDLYEGGLNRGYFLPFVGLLESYCVVHYLGDENANISVKTGGDGNHGRMRSMDYRRIKSGVDEPGSNKCGDYFFLTCCGREQYASQKLDQLYQFFQQNYRQSQKCMHSHHGFNRETTPHKSYRPRSAPSKLPLTLQVNFQRTISIPRYHSNVVARFTFDQLCSNDLGSSDYHAIANHFQIVMVENVPYMSLKYPDRARRFITLVDELYEANCCLVCSAMDIPDLLFRSDNIGNAISVTKKIDDLTTNGGKRHIVAICWQSMWPKSMTQP